MWSLNHDEVVFQLNQGLSSKWAYDHSITFFPGTKLVNVWLYLYVYHHKDEIEHQVLELLVDEIIKHSVSLFPIR